MERAEPLSDSDVAVRRKLIQGVVSANARQWPDAYRFLAQAQSLARASHPVLLGDVALRESSVDFLAGDTTRAKTAYLEAPRIARESKNTFFKASSFSCLVFIAPTEEHL